MKHKPSCLIYICTCEVRNNLEKLKHLHGELKEEILILEEKIERSKDAVKRLNDFSYLRKRREKNRKLFNGSED